MHTSNSIYANYTQHNGDCIDPFAVKYDTSHERVEYLFKPGRIEVSEVAFCWWREITIYNWENEQRQEEGKKAVETGNYPKVFQ
jgi:hypothetical protein